MRLIFHPVNKKIPMDGNLFVVGNNNSMNEF
jgi:hypothetical protein